MALFWKLVDAVKVACSVLVGGFLIYQVALALNFQPVLSLFANAVVNAGLDPW